MKYGVYIVFTLSVTLLHLTVDFNLNLVQDAAAINFLLRSVVTYYN